MSAASSDHDHTAPLEKKPKRSVSASESDNEDLGRGKRTVRPSQKAILAGFASPTSTSNTSTPRNPNSAGQTGLSLRFKPESASRTATSASITVAPSQLGSAVPLNRKAIEDLEKSQTFGELNDSDAAEESQPTTKRLGLSPGVELHPSSPSSEAEGTLSTDNSQESRRTSTKDSPKETNAPAAKIPAPKINAANHPIQYLLQHLRTLPLPSERNEPEKRRAFIGFRDIVIRWLTSSEWSTRAKESLCSEWWREQRQDPFEVEWIMLRDKCTKKEGQRTLAREKAAAARAARATQEANRRRLEAEKMRAKARAIRRTRTDGKAYQQAATALLASLRL